MLDRLEQTVLILAAAALIGLACLQILLRDLWGLGLSWADPLLRVMVLWIGLIGALAATRMNRHIAVNLLLPRLSGPLCGWLNMARQLFSAVVCGVLALVAADFVRQEAAQAGGPSVAWLASWQLNLIFPIAFALISLCFLIGALAALAEALSGKHAPVDGRITPPC